MEYPSGWTCEVVLLRLEFYLAGTLSYADMLALAEHVEACAECAHRLEQGRAAGGAAPAWRG
jgi:hypothetical protein